LLYSLIQGAALMNPRDKLAITFLPLNCTPFGAKIKQLKILPIEVLKTLFEQQIVKYCDLA
jgi:hypothetical protein